VTQHPGSVEEVVTAGLCIGCGLCEAIAPTCWKMTFTDAGRLRPKRIANGDDTEILSVCPGAVIRPNVEKGENTDPIWGSYHRMQKAWSGNADVRYKAATGGVLTSLAMHLLASGKAKFILHCEARPDAPMRTQWCMSDTVGEVAARAGSRYGPSDTLAGIEAALGRDEPFAIVAKPCDCNAVRALQKTDKRLQKNLVALLALVCGGASDLGKSEAVLQEYGLQEKDVTLFRYRGHGNPGPTRVEAKGKEFEKTYNEMWADEGGWRLQSRCKVCADALGEAADLAAADIWENAEPQGDDAGFNGVVTRTVVGETLFSDAANAGALVLGNGITPEEFNFYQPHQVRKKHALAARLRGLEQAGFPVYRHDGLRIEELDTHSADEQQGTHERASDGRFGEKMPQD